MVENYLSNLINMKNFEHECNGKINDSSLESELKCDNCNCNCDNEDITEVCCNCSCHDN